MGFLARLFGKSKLYPVDVNFDAAIKDMVDRGRYQFVGAHELAAMSTVEGPSENRGVVSLTLALLPQQGVSIALAVSGLETRRPAGLRELLAFGARYPEVQMKWSVVAPGTRIERHQGSIEVPRLATGGLGRLLDLQPISHDMNGQEWMLLVVEQ